MKTQQTFILLVLALGAVVIGPSLAQTAPSDQAALTSDPKFASAFELYWQARLAAHDAGNKLCALGIIPYESPKSEYRPINERLIAAGKVMSDKYPGWGNVRRPYIMPPPQICMNKDQDEARKALVSFSDAVTKLELALEMRGQ